MVILRNSFDPSCTTVIRLFARVGLLLGLLLGDSKAGDVTVNINANSVLSDVSQHPIGINMDYLMDDDSRLASPPARSTKDALVAMGVKYLRYPGGEKSQNYLWSVSPWNRSNPRAALPGVFPTHDTTFFNSDQTTCKSGVLDFDEFMTMSNSLGATPVIVINSCSQYVSGGPTLETLLQTAENWVRYANVVKRYHIKYWMIGNEPWNTNNYGGGCTAAQHAADIVVFSKRMKAVDPTIKIVACGKGYDANWNGTVLGVSSSFDLLSVDGYSNCGSANTSYSVYENTDRIYNDPSAAIANIAKYSQANDATRIRICYYEWNSFVWSYPSGWGDVADQGHALLNFQMQGDMLNKPGWDFSCFWNTRWVGDDPKYLGNALKVDGSFTPVGQSLAIWGRNVLDKMVLCASSSPLVRPYACTANNSGAMNAFFVNKDTHSQTVVVSLSAYTPQSSVRCWRMTGTDAADTSSVLAQSTTLKMNGNIVTVTLPPVSITVLKFSPLKVVPSPRVTGPANGRKSLKTTQP
jgi:alpha-N-arabinofuranosidase